MKLTTLKSEVDKCELKIGDLSIFFSVTERRKKEIKQKSFEGIQEDGVGSIRNLSSHLDNNCTDRICLVQLF